MSRNGKDEERRTYKTGSYTRISDTKVRLFVSAGTGLGKKRNRFSKTVVAKTDREAERALTKYIQAVAGKAGGNVTLNDLIDVYTELHVSNLSEQSQRWYNDTFRRIRGALGYVALENITPVIIERFYRALEDPAHEAFWEERIKSRDGKIIKKSLRNGLGITTIQHHHRALSAVLKWGYAKEYLTTPIIDRVKAPTNTKKEERVLSDEERSKFLAELDIAARRGAKRFGKDGPVYTTQIELLGRLALAMGIRRGELCGLAWADIDGPVLHVQHSLQAIKGKGLVLGPTKTSTSNRYLKMPDELVTALKTWRKIQVSHMFKHGLGAPTYVFERLTGGPLDPRHVSAIFTRIFRDAEIEGAKLHSLRHTCATFLMAQGVPPNDVAAFMGHSSSKMTLDVYGHAQSKSAAKCALAAASLLE